MRGARERLIAEEPFVLVAVNIVLVSGARPAAYPLLAAVPGEVAPAVREAEHGYRAAVAAFPAAVGARPCGKAREALRAEER